MLIILSINLTLITFLIEGVTTMKLKTISKVAIGVSTLTFSLSSFAYNLPIVQGNSLFSDNSAESLVNCTPGADGCGSSSLSDTTVDVGDRLHGIFVIDDISGQSILGGSGFDELSGVFDITVTNKISGTDLNGLPAFSYEFGVTSGFAAEHGLGNGAATAWYTDPNHEFARESNSGLSEEQLEALITDGELLWSTGFTDAAFWNATLGTDDVNLINAGNIAGGQFVMGLNFIDNNSGLNLGTSPCLDLGTPVLVSQCANGGILTPNPLDGFTTPFDVWDDVNFNTNVLPPEQSEVPVPAAAWLFGSALFGLIGVSRRRKS